MTENAKGENLFVLAFMVTRSDILAWTNEMGIPSEKVNDKVIEVLKKKIVQDTARWQEFFENRVKEVIKCPLDMVCSSSCPWQEVGKCTLPAVLGKTPKRK